MNSIEIEAIKNAIRPIPDFPEKGILFRDITPILEEPKLINQIIKYLIDEYSRQNLDAVACVESRGFIFGVPVALGLGVPIVLIRKAGKLPSTTHSASYSLEYGESTIEMHTDSVKKNDRILIIDDLLATGGTAEAAVNLVEEAEGVVAGLSFVIELIDLKGRERLKHYEVFSLIQY